MREFVACGNDTTLHYYSILEQKPSFSLRQAHSDNVAKVQFVSDSQFLSGSSDNILKLWDIRNYSQAVDQLKLGYSIADFCRMDGDRWVVANGNCMSVVGVEGQGLQRTGEYYGF